MDGDKNSTATFSQITYTLTLEATTNGSIAANPAGPVFNSGDTVELTATPDVGYVFAGWTGDASGTVTPLTLTMDGDKTVGASFIEETAITYTLTVNVVGNGSVANNPAGTIFAEGTVVELTAAPDVDWKFDGWTPSPWHSARRGPSP